MPDVAAIAHVLLDEEAMTRFPGGVGESFEVPFDLRDDGDLAVVGTSGPLRARVVRVDESVPDDLPTAPLVLALPTQSSASRPYAVVGPESSRRTVDVTVRPARADVFDRIRGVFESDRVRDASVMIVGCGSGGSFVLREIVRCGVGNIVLIDHDRLEVANICRHELGLGDLGRLKVNALRQYVLDRNPDAVVDTHAFRLDGTTYSQFLEIVRRTQPQVIVCGTDNRESRLLVNRAAIDTDTVSLYGGVRRRAYAGQVLRVIPGLTPCYQCFIAGLPEAALDQEVSSVSDSQAVAYSDRPVTPEPGLSTDIAPVALFMAKLVLLELIEQQTSPAFDSLREDLVAPWYFWLNRREPDTEYQAWPPLHDRTDGPAVLRWMGQWLDRDPHCPACGVPQAEASAEDLAVFGAVQEPSV